MSLVATHLGPRSTDAQQLEKHRAKLLLLIYCNGRVFLACVHQITAASCDTRVYQGIYQMLAHTRLISRFSV